MFFMANSRESANQKLEMINDEKVINENLTIPIKENVSTFVRPKNLSLTTPTNRPKNRPKLMRPLDFSLNKPNRSSSEKNLPSLNMNGLKPQYIEQDEDEKKKMSEIMEKSGILEINYKKVKIATEELLDLGELGHGNYGYVFKMKHSPTNCLMAVKRIQKSGRREDKKRTLMDIDIVLKSQDCPFIVKCLGYFINEADVWICMELMDTCLDKLMRKIKHGFPEYIIGKVAVATVNALNYLKEKHSVIHRDVKPSNILINKQGDIKLCDFGISGRLNNSKAQTRNAGCVAYLSPERLQPEDYGLKYYDVRADVWSLGITLIELSTGMFPYPNCSNDFEVLSHIVKDDPPSPPRNSSLDFCSFCNECLRKDPKTRPKYKPLLNHQFIKRYTEKIVDVSSWYRRELEMIESDIKSS